jgi:predicted RNA-binding Zn ribbon-like protein
MDVSDAPAGLALVIDFVNTLDIEQGTDLLQTPDALGAWLTARELTAPGAPTPGEYEYRHALALREALRALMLANNGGAAAKRAAVELELAARRGALGVHFTAGDSISLAPGVQGVDGALAALLVPVAQAIGEGTWQRVKACRADDCHWAFYDRSRNHSGVWCDMAVCGNRTKVRAYRERGPLNGS